MINPKNQWKTNDDWAWFVGENREPIRLTTKARTLYFTKKRCIGYKRQVAPTIKNGTSIRQRKIITNDTEKI